MSDLPAQQISSISNMATNIPKPRSMLAQGVSWLLISGAVFVAAWIATYFRYANQRSLLTENVLVLNLFVLPVILTGVIAFGRYLYRSYLAQQAEAEQVRQQAIATEKAAEAAKQARAADRRFDHISILAASVYTPLGTDAADIIKALEEKGPMAALSLDSSLLDLNGHTLITARIQALDESEAEDNSHTTRIASILHNTLDELFSGIDIETLQSAISLSNAPAKREAEPEIEAFYQLQDSAPPLPELQVHLILPEGLPAQSHTSLSNQLREQIKASALRQLPLVLTLHQDASVVYPLLNTAISTLRETTSQIILLAGVDSMIDESLVNTLLMQNKIRTVNEAGGRLSADKVIPGEGGGALLLMNASLALHGITPLATIYRPAIATESETGSDMISRAHLHATEDGNQPPPDIAHAFCDSPHSRSNMDVAKALSIALHHIDPVAQRVPVNQSFGHIGMASSVTSLALAAQYTAQAACGAICIGAQEQLIAAVTLLPVNTASS